MIRTVIKHMTYTHDSATTRPLFHNELASSPDGDGVYHRVSRMSNVNVAEIHKHINEQTTYTSRIYEQYRSWTLDKRRRQTMYKRTHAHQMETNRYPNWTFWWNSNDNITMKWNWTWTTRKNSIKMFNWDSDWFPFDVRGFAYLPSEDDVCPESSSDTDHICGMHMMTKHLTNMHMSTVQKNEIFSSHRQGRSQEAPEVVWWEHQTVDMCMLVKCFVTCSLIIYTLFYLSEIAGC